MKQGILFNYRATREEASVEWREADFEPCDDVARLVSDEWTKYCDGELRKSLHGHTKNGILCRCDAIDV